MIILTLKSRVFLRDNGLAYDPMIPQQVLMKSLNNVIYNSISNDSRRVASDNVTDSSVLSNPANAQNVSCLGLCGRVLSTLSC